MAKEVAAKAEEERLTKEAAAKAEKEHQAKVAAAKAEEERLTKEVAAKAEKERLAKEAEAKEEADRLTKEVAAAKAEEERLAKEAAANAEAAAEKASGAGSCEGGKPTRSPSAYAARFASLLGEGVEAMASAHGYVRNDDGSVSVDSVDETTIHSLLLQHVFALEQEFSSLASQLVRHDAPMLSPRRLRRSAEE